MQNCLERLSDVKNKTNANAPYILLYYASFLHHEYYSE